VQGRSTCSPVGERSPRWHRCRSPDLAARTVAPKCRRRVICPKIDCDVIRLSFYDAYFCLDINVLKGP